MTDRFGNQMTYAQVDAEMVENHRRTLELSELASAALRELATRA